MRYRLARCPGCGKFTGIGVSSTRRRCPYCGGRISQRDKVSSTVYNAAEMVEVVKSANSLSDDGANMGK